VTKSDDFIVDFLREFEAIFKKALTRVSGALGELLDEKKTKVENPCVRVPLTKNAEFRILKIVGLFRPMPPGLELRPGKLFFKFVVSTCIKTLLLGGKEQM
jgi:hypothetical protein